MWCPLTSNVLVLHICRLAEKPGMAMFCTLVSTTTAKRHTPLHLRLDSLDAVSDLRCRHACFDDGNPVHEGLDIHVPHSEQVHSSVVERFTNELQVEFIQDGKVPCSNMSMI
jgi:hypothetical protein